MRIKSFSDANDTFLSSAWASVACQVRLLWHCSTLVKSQPTQFAYGHLTAKLKAITSKCFPKSASGGLIPKDGSLDVFAEVLLMMSESRLDFVMKVSKWHTYFNV